MIYVTTPVEVELSNKYELEVNLGEISVGKALPDYEGPYFVIPRVYEQTLDTNEKSMRDDVTIAEIPLTEVSNPQGGKTATIG